jgi:3-hydroxyacyl-[acyl-carrier-protein] dehydratase
MPPLDFYDVDSFTETADRIQAKLRLHPEHAIFKGHFPHHPVVPGVCMMQIMKELTEKKMDHSVRIAKASLLKFLTMIDPRSHSVIQAEIHYRKNDRQVLISGKLFFEELVFMKCEMELKTQPLFPAASLNGHE